MGEYFVVRRGATALRNETVWDDRISFGALGILARALATRPGAHLGYRAFTGRGMGEKSVRAALRELEEAGYRHRFTIRAGSGQLRTVTVFSDVPISREEAMADVDEQDRARMVGVEAPGGDDVYGDPGGCVEQVSNGYPQDGEPTGYPQDHSPSGHRAAASAARWPDRQDSGEKSDVTVPRSTVARSTALRSTALRSTEARSSAALSLRDTNISSLRSEIPPDQTGPDQQEAPSPARPVRDSVGSGLAGARPGDGDGAAGAARGGPGAASGLSEGDRRVVAQCLPESMRALDSGGLVVVAGLLRERLSAGWRPAEIRSVMDQPLPSRVGRLSALVASRLERNVDPSAAPVRDAAVDHDAAHEARARRSEALAGTPRRSEPEDRWAWDQVRRQMPDASPLEQAMAVLELVGRRAGAPAGAG